METKTIPVELQSKWIALLSPKSLTSLCLVSRNMRTLAFPLLHRCLVLSPRSTATLARRIVAENEENVPSLHGLRLTDHVRQITFLGSFRSSPDHEFKTIDRDALQLASKALPFLKHVTHLQWFEIIGDNDQQLEPEFSTFVQSARDAFGEKLQNLEMYFEGYNKDHTYSVESASRTPLFTFPHLKQLRIGSSSWKSDVSAHGAFLDMDSYYSPFCDNLGELAPSLEILDFSTTFHNSLDIIGNFFSSLEKSIHFPRLRELHIRAPFNDDESCEEGSTPLVAFIRRHATQLEALSLPCPIEDFDNDYLYEPLDLPSLPKLTKLDAPVLWANLLIDRDLIPNLSELKVWLTLPRENDTEFQTQETSKEELEPLLAKLSEVHTLRALDLCQSSFEFDTELLDMLAAACPSLEWLGILILEADDNWTDITDSLSQFKSLHTLRAPDFPQPSWDYESESWSPSEATHDAVRALAEACPSMRRLEWVSEERSDSLSLGCSSVHSVWEFNRGAQDIEVDHTRRNAYSVDAPWKRANPA